MSPDDKLELVIQVDVSQGNDEIKQFNAVDTTGQEMGAMRAHSTRGHATVELPGTRAGVFQRDVPQSALSVALQSWHRLAML